MKMMVVKDVASSVDEASNKMAEEKGRWDYSLLLLHAFYFDPFVLEQRLHFQP